MMKKEILFGIPVIKTRIDPKLYDKSKIINTIHKNYKLDPDRNEWNDGEGSRMHHSYNDWDNKKFKLPNFDKLIKVYENVIKEAIHTYQLKSKISIVASIKNYTCMKKTQSMQQHNHLTPIDRMSIEKGEIYEDQADFTSIHYIKFNSKKHKSTVFKSSQAFGKYYDYMCPTHKDFLDDTYAENSFMFNEYYFDTLEDDIIFLPSILEHYIPIQTSDETRITVVANIRVEIPKY